MRLVRSFLVFIGFIALSIAVASCAPMPPASAGSPTPGPADTNPPVGTVLSPLPDSWATNSYIYLRVRYTDPDGINTYSLSMTLDGLSLTPSWYNYVLTTYASDLPEGPHTAEARAWDQAGNGPTVVTWSFFIDSTLPSVTITTPSRNPELADGSVTLAWTGSDIPSGIDHYEVTLDDGPSLDVGLATTLPFPDLAPGVHYFFVEAYDVAGNYNSTIAMATVPASSAGPPPQVTVIVPDQIPLWGVALVAISVVEAAGIAWLAIGRRRPPPATPGP